MQSRSAGQDRQFVAVPAAGGFWDLRNWVREPVEVMVRGWMGCCEVGSEEGGGLESNHMMKSMSWQDLVSREPSPLGVSRRQLPRT